MIATEGSRPAASAGWKIVIVGLLGLLLMVPLIVVSALVFERESRRDEVTTEVSRQWGGRQTAGGVVLLVPFEIEERLADQSTRRVRRTALLLPEALSVDAVLQPEVRTRSLFPVTVYRSTVRVKGHFAATDLFARFRVTPAEIFWDQSRLLVSLTDTRGAIALSPLTWRGGEQAFEPADTAANPFDGALQARAAADPAAGMPFGFEMTLAGTGSLRFLPLGKATDVHLTSPWPHPGFAGAFLPETRTVGASGFEARWRVSYLARSVPHAWIHEETEKDTRDRQFSSAEFGVDLVSPVDHYQQVWRAVKYGLLFILLTFAVFLVWDVRRALDLHPIQYLLVGCALVVFYMLLLSLSEHLHFAWAYGIAAAATTALVAGYAGRVLASGPRGASAIGGWLAVLYGFLFVVLQLEDLALLVGSLALFLMLAVLMYLTRHVDWYTMRTREARI